MKGIEIKKDVYWVGARDWNARNFHGYEIPLGTSYNAYLIKDEKITLVDTVKKPFTKELMDRIKSIVNLEKIHYIVCNHVEMDHSGALPEIIKLAKNAEIITDLQGKNSLSEHYNISDWKVKIVKSGDVVNIGKRNLSFIQTPMLHWPDSMFTYIKEEKLLLPNDAFGQHIATDKIFANENSLDSIYDIAKNYYANILFPFSNQANKALDSVKNLELDMIAPSHGCIWQNKEVNKIISLYERWANAKNKNKAVIIYDTMWNSTESLAKSIQEELEFNNIDTIVKSLKSNHISDIITELIDAKYVFIGTSVLNNEVLPSVAAFLTYMKGLAPKNKIGFIFGSFGWSIAAFKNIEDILDNLKWETPLPYHAVKYIPKEKDKNEIKEKVRELLKF